jgi:hypothetical protein
MSTHVVLRPANVSPAAFVDATTHRAELPPVYNSYTRVAADALYDRAREAEIALFRPLFTTSFLLDDFFAENGFFGARSVVLSSASSKTALGLAFLLSHGRRADAVALTSRTHVGFVAKTGYYGTASTYDDIESLPADAPAAFVDFAGNGEIVRRIHRRLGGALRYSARVGVTHWDRMATPDDVPGPTPVFFFAPDQARRRVHEWGAAAFQERVGESMRAFLASTAPWLRIVEGRGPETVEAVYRATVDGRTDPAEGHVLSL